MWQESFLPKGAYDYQTVNLPGSTSRRMSNSNKDRFSLTPATFLPEKKEIEAERHDYDQVILHMCKARDLLDAPF